MSRVLQTFPRAVAAVLVVLWLGSTPAPAAPLQGASSESRLQVYAYTLKHQQADEALALVRPLLSPRGTVEVQPGGNTLVIRETRPVIARISDRLAKFDHPPEELRFEIQIVRASPKRSGVGPPQPEGPEVPVGELSEEQAARLREHLRYDVYQVLAKAGVTSMEGEEVLYSLGQSYSVSFRPGAVIDGKRVKLEGFKILKQVQNPSNKGRRLEPRELFHATLNLWIDRPFNVVLAQDESRQEALMVAISCRREQP